ALLETQLGDLPEAACSHGREIYRRREGTERRIGADVARRLGAADMLLTGRKRQHVAAAAISVDGFAAQMAGQPPHMGHACTEDSEVRSAERRRNPQRLAFGHDYVRPIGARRPEQSERDRIRRDDEETAGAMYDFGQALDRLPLAKEIGVLDDE